MNVFYFILIFVQFLFGINFVASKIVVTTIPPVEWAIIRFVVSGLILMTIAILYHRKKFQMSWNYIGHIAFYSLLSITISQIAFLKGIRLTSSINTAIIASTIPIFTLIAVILRRQEHMSIPKLFGFILAFLGVLAIRNIEDFSLSNETFIGDMLVLLCSASTGLGIAFSKKFFTTHDHWWASSWMFVMGAVQISLYSIFDPEAFIWPTWHGELLGSAIFCIIGATLMTYFLSNWALVHVDSGKVSLFIYLQPVFAAFIAWIYLGETISVRTGVSILLIMSGFLLALKKRKKRDANG